MVTEVLLIVNVVVKMVAERSVDRTTTRQQVLGCIISNNLVM